jgi:glycosyltransferase involved in cell wall biosynthesis
MKILIYRRVGLVGSRGGVERILTSFSNEMTNRGHQVFLLTNDRKKEELRYPLSEKVYFKNIGGTRLKGVRSALLHIFGKRRNIPLFLKKNKCFNEYYASSCRLKKEIDAWQPDIIIGTCLKDIMDILYEQNYDIPVGVMFHNNIDYIFNAPWVKRMDFLKDELEKVSFCQILISAFEEKVRRYYKGPVFCIPNPIEQQEENVSYSLKDKYTIMMQGRVEKMKYQELIVRAFALLKEKYPQWQVEFWGQQNPAYTKEILRLINENGLQKRVFLKGMTSEPLKELLRADICAFSSVSEGFGLAVGEAMSVGLPCVGLLECSSVNEIIEDGKTGFLSPKTPEDFAKALSSLMDSPDLRKRLGTVGKLKIKAYTPKIIWDKWENLLISVIEKTL